MKKLALVLALTLTALAGSAFAIDWSADNVGIYLDEAASTNCGPAAPFTPVPAFLVLTNLSTPDINAWEIALTYSNVISLSFQPRGYSPIDVGINPGEHLVGLAEALVPVNGTVVIADMTLMVQNTNPASISCNGVFFHSLDAKVPAFQGTDEVIRELRPISPTGSPILTINGDCVVATETSSFGNVKSLFR